MLYCNVVEEYCKLERIVSSWLSIIIRNDVERERHQNSFFLEYSVTQKNKKEITN